MLTGIQLCWRKKKLGYESVEPKSLPLPPFLLYGLKVILCKLQMFEMPKQNVCNQQMCNILKQNVEAKEPVLADVQSRDKLNLAITSNQATTTIQRDFLFSIFRSLESFARHSQSLDFF